MGFGKGSYARIFGAEDKGKYHVARMAVSKKGDDGNYETTWSDNFVRLVGTAHEQAKSLNIGDKGVSVKIGNCDVTNKYDKEKKVTYTNYVIFGFEDMDNNNAAPAKKDDSFMNIPDGVDEELPFA